MINIASRIDAMIEKIESNSAIKPDDAYDMIADLQAIKAKAIEQASDNAAALRALHNAGIALAPDLARQFQPSTSQEN